MSLLITIVSGFASGVFLRSLFNFGWPVVVFMFLLATLLFIVPKMLSAYSLAPLERESSSFLVGLGAIFFLFCVFGMLRVAASDTQLPEAFVSDLKHRVSYQGTVIADPDVREKNQRIALVIEKGTETAGALAVMPLSSDVRVGDRVRVYGTLSLPHAFETENGRTFRYDKYLEVRGINFLIQYGSIHRESSAPWYSISAALARIKHSFLDGLNRALPNPDAALAGGIVIGGKEGLGNTLRDAFIRSGLVQIIVLSGYNVMIVAEWMMAFLALWFLPNKFKLFVGGVTLLLFVGIAGISATALRAAVMAIIALYARATGRTYAAGRALLFVILLMLIWNPLYLVFDPGFGLSIVATAGLIWLAPLIEIMLSFIKNAFWKNVIATTLAAQIAVLPLLLYNIGLFSLVAIPANILVSPLVPFAMALAAIAGVVGMTIGTFSPLVATIVGYPVFILMRYFIFIAEKSSALPFAAFNLPLFSFWFVLVAYTALIYFASSKRFSTMLQLRFAKKASM